MRWGIVAAIGLCVSGCAASVPTVTFYKTHRHELDRRLDDCIARGEASQDCANAKQAFYELNGMPSRDGKPTKP